MKPDREDSESNRGKRKLPGYTKLSLRQLYLLSENQGSGVQTELSKDFKDLTDSKVSRDMKELREYLGVKSLDDEALKIVEAFLPLKNLLNRYEGKDAGRIIRIGAGGSILGWLIGSKIDELRDICRGKEDSTDVTNIQVNCTPMKNREILQGVRLGTLDFGVVRNSLLHNWKNDREIIDSEDIGTQRYYLILPRTILEKYSNGDDDSDILTAKTQEKILGDEYISTVAAEGEFAVQLEAALADRLIKPKIEFSYRSFPQIIPHLLNGTHVGIAPLAGLWDRMVPECKYYPLEILAHYQRPVSLIYSPRYRPNWLNIDRLKNLLTIPSGD